MLKIHFEAVVYLDNFVLVEENFILKTKVYRYYFWEFYNAQTEAVKDKIDWVVALVRTLQQVPEKYLKHMEGTDGL